MRIHPVILCGGSGTRLWPASRSTRPKQFLPLTGSLSLFQATLRRFDGLEAAPAVVVAGSGHLEALQEQLTGIGREATLLIEPEGRDSAPAIAAAAHWVHARDRDGVVVVVASDHHIPDGAAFRDAVARAAAAAAASGAIVTFGVTPTGPATAYGYIEAGPPLAEAEGVRAVARFVEKPDAATAERYVAQGLLWNSGNFVFRAESLISELALHAPEVAAHAAAAVEAADVEGGVVRLGPAFRDAPKISIDYALMEKTGRAAVAQAGFAWSDLGAWDAVWAAADKDAEGLAGRDALLMGCRDVLVRSAGPKVVGIGLERVAVVCEPDAVLVCALDDAQGVKAATDVLRAERPALLSRTPVPGGWTTARLGRWLRANALPLWWSIGADHAGGGFHEALDQDGQPVRSTRRLRVQARQIFTYAAALEAGWAGPARDAVAHGVDYLLSRYQRPDGLFRPLVGPDGAPVESLASLYDHAFTLLALAAAAAALPDRADRLAERAETIMDRMEADWRAPGGGFAEHDGAAYQANAHMHLFEAVQAWAMTSGAARWRRVEDEIGRLCLDRFVAPGGGVLREFFEAGWSPAPGTAGRIVEPGHQFEWAWLLTRWAGRGGDPAAAETAQRLIAAGAAGIDRARNVAMDALLDDGTVHDAAARLWPQTERMKAAHLLGDPAEIAAAAAGLGAFLETPIAGLWRDRMNADGAFVEQPAPASSLYHIAGAVLDAEAGGR